MIMKIRLITLLIGLAGSLNPGLFRASAEMEVSVGVSIHATTEFYEPLATSGTWVEVGSYGRCWHPAGVAVEWRPYCEGSWEWTDSGWYWVSDEPWAWACYHYGTWNFDPDFGWIWVPGIEWAPAWVEWRVGGGYIGWVPLAPRGVVIAPSLFVFVDAGHFSDPIRPSTVIVNNTTIIKSTTTINNVTRESRNFSGKSQTVVVNKGPDTSMVEKATGKKFEAVSVRDVDSRTSASVPEKLKRQSAEPATRQKPSTIQQQQKEQPDFAPERKLPPGGNQETPPKNAVQPDRTIPQAPPEKTIPPAEKETPLNRQQQPPRENQLYRRNAQFFLDDPPYLPRA